MGANFLMHENTVLDCKGLPYSGPALFPTVRSANAPPLQRPTSGDTGGGSTTRHILRTNEMVGGPGNTPLHSP